MIFRRPEACCNRAVSPSRRFKAVGAVLIASSTAKFVMGNAVHKPRWFPAVILAGIVAGIGLIVKGINLKKEERQNG